MDASSPLNRGETKGVCRTGETKFVDMRNLGHKIFPNKHPKDKSLRPGDRVKSFTSGKEGQTLEGVATLIQRNYQRSDSTDLEYWQVKFDSGYEIHQADNDCWRVVESQKQSWFGKNLVQRPLPFVTDARE